MAEKAILIPARLKSGVVDGHVTGTADIIDDEMGKTQDVINSEVSGDISDAQDDIILINSKISAGTTSSNKLTNKSYVDNLVAAEETRAKAAEQTNATAILAEQSRAESAEQTLQNNISAENTRATGAEATLQSNITVEETRAKAAELANTNAISTEETRAKAAEKQNADDIDAIENKIPSQATPENQLADKAFVNSSIATATAEFKGTYNTLEELQAIPADKNDYGFVRSTDAAGNTIYSKYKYNGTAWLFEYDLNNSSFTAVQWAAINSLLTVDHKTKLDALPTKVELDALFESKQDVISDLETIRSGATLGATAYQKPGAGIPKTDLDANVQSSLGKADTALQTHQDISGKADKASTVSSVDYDTTNKKLKITINEVSSDVVTVAKLKEDMGLSNVADIDQSKAVKSFSIEGGTVTYTCLDDTTGTFTIPTYTDFQPSGETAASGLVPKPSTTEGWDKFLCEDGTWKKPYESSYDLPIASSTTLGGVRIGEGLAIDSRGVLSTLEGAFKRVYIGTGKTYQDVMVVANYHATLRKGATTDVTSSENYLWVIIPIAFYPTVTMEGIRIPMTSQEQITVDNIDYNVLKSDNTFTGTFGVILI